MNTIKVRVKTGVHTDDFYWYGKRRGEVFEVNATPEDYYGGIRKMWRVVEGPDRSAGIWSEDAEIVPAEPRLYLHEGKEYQLPEWATYVTCDGEGKALFAWENMPKWTEELGYWLSERESQRQRLYVYVKPLPEGSFIEAV